MSDGQKDLKKKEERILDEKTRQDKLSNELEKRRECQHPQEVPYTRSNSKAQICASLSISNTNFFNYRCYKVSR